MAQSYLWEDTSRIGLDYLLGTRKLSEKVLRDFRVGYLPEDLNHQLHGRIIMPLYDASDNLICITSRHPSPSDSDFLPHYWHETYEKSFYLYGINIAKYFMRKFGFATVVEGQIDAMQLHKNGLHNAVAACGTSLSLMQYASIFRYCSELIVILDNDPNQAGQKGADRFREMTLALSAEQKNSIWKNRCKIGFVNIVGAKDPDEYIIKYGYQSLRSKIKDALSEIQENVF